MDSIDRSIRNRLHRAGEEMTARPLQPLRSPEQLVARRTLQPLLAAVALAVSLGGVAAGVGLHARLGARQPAPAVTPSTAPSPPVSTPTPVPTPQSAAAPFISMFNDVQVAWDSTHRQLAAYVAASATTGYGASVWSWDGRWQQHASPGGPDANGGGIWVDDPGLGGVVEVGGNARMAGTSRLWNGTGWSPLPDPPSQDCMIPARAAYDVHRKQLVVLFTDQCSGGTTVLPGETWTLDGRSWHRHADSPGDRQAVPAWDPGTDAVVLLGADPAGKARAWRWTGTRWIRGATSTVAYPSAPLGAAWDAATGAVVLYGDRGSDGSEPARVIAFRRGAFVELPQSGAPLHTQGVVVDLSEGRLIALGQQPQAANATPAPSDRYKQYYVIAWTGTTWIPVADVQALRIR